MANHRMAGRSSRGTLGAGAAAQLSPIDSPAHAELQPLVRQAFAEQLLDRVPEAIVLLDQGSRILRVNPEFTRLFGYSPEEAGGRVIDDLIVPDYKKHEGGRLGREVKAGKTVEIETKRRRKDGTSIDVSLLVTPVTTPEGQVGYYAIYRDISHRKRAENLQAALYRIAEISSSAEDLNALYGAIHAIVGELMYAKNFYVALFDKNLEMVTVPYFVDEFDPHPGSWKLRNGVTDYVLRTGEPLLATPEREAELRAKGKIEILGTPSSDWMGIPLKRGEETFGVLVVQSYDAAHRYTEKEKEILMFVSQQVANAIQSKRKQDELRDSEAKFRAVAETAPCAIFIYRDGKPLYVNPAGCAMTGYSREELMAMEVFDILHPHFQHFARKMAAARAGGQNVPAHHEFKFITKTGEERWVDFRGTTVHYQGGVALLGIAFDMTEKKAADESLRMQSALLEQLFEASPEAVLLLDTEHRVMKVNREFTRLFGYATEEALGKTASQLSIVPEGKKNESREIIRTVEESKSLNIETQRCSKEGTLIDVSILGTPIEIDGKSYGYYAIYRDISSRKKAERELHDLNLSLEQRVRERTSQLQDANQELEAFSYSVSHDLRAPLRHIDGFVKLLMRREQGKLDAVSEKYFHDIADSSRHMGELIDDLLAFSRTSRVELKEQTVDLTELFESVRGRLQHEIKGKRQVIWKFSQMPAVRADYSLLRIAVSNLLSNALKYSKPRDVSHISAGVHEQKGEVVTIFIRDNGVGFDMQYAHKLFGVFQRLHRDEEFEGTGIGLATVRRIIARHGGHVWGEAEVDRGATFYFTLRTAHS
jgi:PAS domain S-box-containing protein